MIKFTYFNSPSLILTFFLSISLFNISYSQEILPKLDPLKTIMRDTGDFYFKEIWIKSKDINKDDPAGFLRRASDKMELGYKVEAFSDINKAISIDSNSVQAYILKGLILLKLDSINSSLKCFSRAVSLNDTSINANFYLAETYVMTGKYKVADSLYKKVIALNKNFYHAYFSLANLSLITYDYQDAEEYYKIVIDLKPDYYFAYFNMALMYTAFDLNKALKSLNKAIAINPNFANAYYLKGYINWDNNLIKATFKDWNRAVEIEPNNTLFKISLGFLYIIDKEYNTGFSIVSNALITSKQNNLYSYFEKSTREKITNDFLSQVIVFNRYAHQFTSGEKDKIANALCLFYHGKFKNTEELYSSMVSNFPTSGILHYLRGLNFEYLQQADRALESFDKSISQNDFPEEAYLRKGIVLNILQRYQEAIHIFKKFLINNDSVRLAHRLLAGTYLSFSRYDSAIIQLTELIKNDSTELDIYLDRASTYKFLKKYQEAENDYSYILRYKPYDLVTNCLLAECKFLRGDTINAYRLLNTTWNKFNYLTESGHFIRGTINLYYTKYDSAIFDFTRVIIFNNEHSDAYLYRGLCYYCKEDFSSAKTDFSSVIKFKSDDITALYTRGLTHLKLNEKDDAYNDLKKAEEFGHPLAKRAILIYLKDFKLQCTSRSP